MGTTFSLSRAVRAPNPGEHFIPYQAYTYLGGGALDNVPTFGFARRPSLKFSFNPGRHDFISGNAAIYNRIGFEGLSKADTMSWPQQVRISRPIPLLAWRLNPCHPANTVSLIGVIPNYQSRFYRIISP